MKDQREIYDKIDAYLQGQMTQSEQTAFKAAMKKDTELAEAVALHRDLQQMLGEQPVNALRKNLTTLEAGDYPDAKNSNWWTIAAIIGLAIIASVWWMMSVEGEMPRTSSTTTEMPIEQPAETESSPLQPSDKIDNNTTPSIEIPMQEEAEPEQQKESTKKSQPKSQPIAAADFTPNPNLEFFIANNYRSDAAIQLSAKPPAKSANPLFQLRLTGELITTQSDLKNIQIHLFSNDPLAFTEFQPLLILPIELNNVTEEKSTFAIDKLMELKAGLYYYLIENVKTEEVLFVDKFEINLF
ncbi:MAG: hypothetical protein AB8G22_15000 [Saprospiraceae bacterium]